ncbi:BTB POZ domain containing protein [Rutstroemia sp. NJR-2017a BVV2]|nr:BTB POZ domain containing protein [Rutstroemia sp. NJR-2017a BVV2]
MIRSYAQGSLAEAFELFFSYLSFTETVQIYVGKKRKCWTLNKELICDVSEYFRAAFKGDFAESNGVLNLEEEDPEIFAHLVNWMYSPYQILMDNTLFRREAKDDLVFIKLYVLADRFFLQDLKSAVIEYLQEFLGRGGTDDEPRICDVQYIYTHTINSNHPLRKYVVKATLVSLFDPWYPEPDEPEDRDEVRERPSFVDLTKCNAEFSHEVLVAIQKHLLENAGVCKRLQKSYLGINI